jgi:hypothetical protein
MFKVAVIVLVDLGLHQDGAIDRASINKGAVEPQIRRRRRAGRVSVMRKAGRIRGGQLNMSVDQRSLGP